MSNINIALYVKNELGLPRISVSCRACGERWIEETDPSLVGLTHRCEKVVEALKRGIGKPDQEAWALAVMHQAIHQTPIVWKDTGKPTRCTHGCKHAKGAKCDCECGGKFHGKANVVKSLALRKV